MGFKCILKSTLMFLFRFMVVACLLKSGLDIVIVNNDTPKTIVSKTHTILTRIQRYFYVDQDIVMRNVMLYQKQISLFYGSLILAFCSLVIVNCRFFVKPLISLIISSILFFYVEWDTNVKYLISD